MLSVLHWQQMVKDLNGGDELQMLKFWEKFQVELIPY